jgi:hypothetical protein
MHCIFVFVRMCPWQRYIIIKQRYDLQMSVAVYMPIVECAVPSIMKICPQDRRVSPCVNTVSCSLSGL